MLLMRLVFLYFLLLVSFSFLCLLISLSLSLGLGSAIGEISWQPRTYPSAQSSVASSAADAAAPVAMAPQGSQGLIILPFSCIFLTTLMLLFTTASPFSCCIVFDNLPHVFVSFLLWHLLYLFLSPSKVNRNGDNNFIVCHFLR